MSETPDNLSWVAFRYVANELDATESREFESLLLTDQAAREAVANAVEETTRIRQALAGEAAFASASQQSIWHRKTTRFAVVGVGSCLVLLLALCLVRSSPPVSGVVAHQTVESELPISPARLAYAWAEARNGLTDLQPATDVEFANTLDAILNEPLHSEFDESLVAPSWMLAALVKMDGASDSNRSDSNPSDSNPHLQE